VFDLVFFGIKPRDWLGEHLQS